METPIKQIACGRRKPNMTRKEYNDHRFLVHGRLTDGPVRECNPIKYIQTPIFDSAFPAAPGGLNLNHPWVGRDDVTELYFSDMAHLKRSFGSDYVRSTIRPDAVQFADFGSAIVLMAREESVALPSSTSANSNGPQARAEEGAGIVATYFLSAKSGSRDGAALRRDVEDGLVRALLEHARGEVVHVLVNVGFESSEFDMNAYFGGKDMPSYALVYKLFMRSEGSVPYVRKAQRAFEKTAAGAVDFSTAFIVFGREALVLDYERDVEFDAKRKPVFDEKEYSQSLCHLEN